MGDIIDAIGQSSQNPCGVDYWAGEPTAIFVVWDDWGGWFDHVAQPKGIVRIDQGPPPPQGYTFCSPADDQWGCGYTVGIRVPLLVISAYANQGYISGAKAYPPSCTPPSSYCHDFGSILNFIEYTFGTSGTRLGGQYGISQDQFWPYADYFAMDYDPRNWNTTYSLSDFFNFGPAGHHGFTTINNWKYPEYCFHQGPNSGCWPTYPVNPDKDANETD